VAGSILAGSTASATAASPSNIHVVAMAPATHFYE
jgi:hypothetical protein